MINFFEGEFVKMDRFFREGSSPLPSFRTVPVGNEPSQLKSLSASNSWGNWRERVDIEKYVVLESRYQFEDDLELKLSRH